MILSTRMPSYGLTLIRQCERGLEMSKKMTGHEEPLTEITLFATIR